MKNIKKVIVELEDGNKMEFEGQAVMFFEDKMSETEKMFKESDTGKICGIVQCRPDFLASVTEVALESLSKHSPGLDSAVILKYLDSKTSNRKSIMSVLEEIFG